LLIGIVLLLLRFVETIIYQKIVPISSLFLNCQVASFDGSLGTQGVDSKYGVTKGSVDTRLGQAKDGGTDYQLV
jgi:hypothetical protein